MVIVAFLTIKAFMKIMIFLTNMKSQTNEWQTYECDTNEWHTNEWKTYEMKNKWKQTNDWQTYKLPNLGVK